MEHNAQQSLEALEKRIAQKQQQNLQTFQKQILQELKALRQTLIKESSTAQAPQTADSDEKDKKIEELTKQNTKLNYRIEHLTRNLRAALQKQ